MADQLELAGIPATPQLTVRQQLAYDYVRGAGQEGVTADEVGAYLHALRTNTPHSVDERCDWCGRDGRSVLTSKAVGPLVTYRRHHGTRFYIARDSAARIVAPAPAVAAPTEAELAANPFAGL